MEPVQSKFRGLEEKFTIVTGMICHFCLTNIKDFAKHKAKHTPAFITEILQRSKGTALISNQDQRQATSTPCAV